MRGKRFPLIVVVLLMTALFFSLRASYSGHQTVESRCNVPFEFVMAEHQSGIAQGRDFVIRDEEEWCRFWDEVYSFLYPPPECNTELIDFTEEVAIISALGTRPNSCYANAITCIEDRVLTAVSKISKKGGVMTVYVEEIIPGFNCHCLFSIVKPVYVVKVKKPVTNVRFVHYETIMDCE
jgi:hypothetical protein